MEYFCHFLCIKQNFASALGKTKKRAIDRVETLSSVKLKRALHPQCASGFCACFLLYTYACTGNQTRKKMIFVKASFDSRGLPKASKGKTKASAHCIGRAKPPRASRQSLSASSSKSLSVFSQPRQGSVMDLPKTS